ncbi:MAG TPA: zinc-ribbon domain-containing protein, partial [Anaerolineales bacterium]|nr:zinc-ribbon domain-containing protein [Anaerolineales bacterium]
MKCPYCGTENPDDAQECSNCSADLGSLFKGTPPPESYAPTMMTSSAEVAAMLAAARGEHEAPAEPVEESSESPAEPAEPEEPVQPEEVPPSPDYAAPTMMTSSAEVAAMLAEARGEPEPEPETPPAPPSDY